MTGEASQRDGELAEHTRLLEELDGLLLVGCTAGWRDFIWEYAEKGVAQAAEAIERATAVIAELGRDDR